MDHHDEDASGISRRDFGKLIGVTGLGLWLAPNMVRTAFAESPNPAKIITGKVPDMIIHNAKLGVMETPLSMLREHDLTPKNILYNRTHFPVSGKNAWLATTSPPNADNWAIQVTGLVNHTRTVHLADLKNMDQVKVTSVMQCAGNGRAYYAAKAKCPGGQWHHGGMGNLQWEGVPLRAVIKHLQLGISPDAKWLTANGADLPPTYGGADFMKSYHLEDPALDHAILALKMNGEPIPAIHGGPVRLIIPGFYGNMNVKFVTNLMFASEQSSTPFQSKAYRVPDKLVQPGAMSVSDFTWYNSKPTYGFTIMSVIFGPLESDSVKAGPTKVHGVAWNDGTVPITSIQVSADGGGTWHAAEIEKPDSPFAWYKWQREVSLDQGHHELMVRATDESGRTQPLHGTDVWNPKGYEWHGVDRVKVQVA